MAAAIISALVALVGVTAAAAPPPVAHVLPAPTAALAALPCRAEAVQARGVTCDQCDGSWFMRGGTNGIVAAVMAVPPPGY